MLGAAMLAACAPHGPPMAVELCEQAVDRYAVTAAETTVEHIHALHECTVRVQQLYDRSSCSYAKLASCLSEADCDAERAVAQLGSW